MCWKYEEEYKGCWDDLTGQAINPCEGYDSTFLESISLVEWLRKNYGVEVVEPLKFDKEVMDMFTRLHEGGVIKPLKK